MTTMLVLPGAAFLFFAGEGWRKSAVKIMVVMAGLFSAVLALSYGCLALRAATKPLLNWGDPSTVDRLWRHVTGKQYQVWLYSSWAAVKKQILYFLYEIILMLLIQFSFL